MNRWFIDCQLCFNGVILWNQIMSRALLASPKTVMVILLNDLTLGARARDKACNCFILLDVCK